MVRRGPGHPTVEPQKTMLGLIFSFVFKTAFLVVCLSVTYLALRRFLLSKSSNAWLYAAMFMLAFLTTLGLSPWLTGFGRTHPIFLLFATMLPAIWYGVVMLCNSTRYVSYDSELENVVRRIATLANAKRSDGIPLLLEEPQWPEAPMAVFQHTPVEPPRIPEIFANNPNPPSSRISETTQSLLGIARSMRGNPSSDRRRMKLLPPPERTTAESMPFLKAGKSA